MIARRIARVAAVVRVSPAAVAPAASVRTRAVSTFVVALALAAAGAPGIGPAAAADEGGGASSPYRLAGFEDAGTFVRIIDGRRVGTVRFTWKIDGAIESRLRLDSESAGPGAVTVVECDDRGLWTAVRIQAPGESVTIARAGDRVTLSSSGSVESHELAPGTLLQGPPALASLPVLRYDAAKGGVQEFPVFALPGRVTHASLERLGVETRSIGGRDLQFTRYLFRRPAGDQTLWTDAAGRLYAALDPATGSGFARAGFESLAVWTPGASASAATPIGDWEGELQSFGQKLRLVLHVRQARDTLSATFDSPDQMAFGLVMDHAERRGDSLRFEMKRIQATYAASFDSGGTVMHGTWRQGALAFPLDMRRRSGQPRSQRRAQDPAPPYPYDTLEVSYENRAAHATFGGTLTLPRGTGPFPVALLITGSGQEDRNEEIFGHRPFLVLADDLTRRGVAVLRVDDRGVGKSTGNVRSATSEDFAGDVMAGIEFLKSRPEIDPKRIGLIGHSEGGLIAPLVATRSRDVAFVVLMAGPGIDGEELGVLQSAMMAKAMGAGDSMIAFGRAVNRLSMAIARQERDTARVSERLRALADSLKAALPEAQRRALGDQPVLRDDQIRLFTLPWFRYFLSYDPAPTLRHVQCPVLAVNGERDLQVPPKENLSAIERALRTGHNRDFKVLELPRLNHLFQTCVTGSITEYHSIEETIAPAALDTIGNWVVAHTTPHATSSPRRRAPTPGPQRAPAR